jgi:hypothetical protein
MLYTISLLAVLLINQRCKCANVGHKMETSEASMETLWNLELLRTTPDVGFEVLTVVVMKSTIFWDITPCSPLSVNRRFGGTYCLHLQDRKNKLSKKPA